MHTTEIWGHLHNFKVCLMELLYDPLSSPPPPPPLVCLPAPVPL